MRKKFCNVYRVYIRQFLLNYKKRVKYRVYIRQFLINYKKRVKFN